METRASYIVVGVFVILGMVGMLAAVMWVAGARTVQATATYDIYFDQNVAGLRPGNAVQYRGIPVGAVVDMRIDPENVERVLVTVEVGADTPIKEDTRATVAMQGITGVAYVLLTGGTQDAPPLEAPEGRDRPVIESVPSQLSELFEAAPELMRRAIRVVERAEAMLGPQNEARIAASLENIETLTGALADSSDDIRTILSEGAAMVSELRQATERANRVLGSMEDGADSITQSTSAILDRARDAVSQLARASEQLADFLRDNREPLTDFSTTGLYEFSQLLAEARVLVAALTRLTDQFERDPARFLFGDRQQGVEVE